MKKKQLMAILNCTPDSFYDGGRYFSKERAINQGLKMIEEGADIIDVGGESTRPGSDSVSLDEEIRRVLPVIEALSSKIPVSIDTSKPEVARLALQAGAVMINDVTALAHPQMREVALCGKAKVVLMHMQGAPKTMQHCPLYPKGVLAELLDWFHTKITTLIAEGFTCDQLILDPGIGFGKSVQDNLTILKNISDFQSLNLPILIGLSRKSFMSKILQKPATELLSTTLALNTMTLLKGVSMIRVHDVKEHRDCIDILESVN